MFRYTKSRLLLDSKRGAHSTNTSYGSNLNSPERTIPPRDRLCFICVFSLNNLA
jgi:hypothetical protein